MTEGSQLYLAGPALVKAAIGQTGRPGGTGRRPHARRDQRHGRLSRARRSRLSAAAAVAHRAVAADPARAAADDGGHAPQRDPRGSVPARSAPTAAASTTCATCWPAWSMPARSRSTGPSTAARWSRPSPASAAGRSASWPTSGSDAARRTGEVQIGGVLYGDSAEKAARFVMECNQTALPHRVLAGCAGIHGRQRGRAVGHHPLAERNWSTWSATAWCPS